ncbi:MAG: hypothetical protein IKU07_07225, partial [Oscillospiraceae bacterium]|nr:hypothetical protein [Oscillospiraceae bacterium]
NDYNANGYKVSLCVFPAEIPSNAQVVAFSYYNYWQEVHDVYLELKFDSLSEMESYLSAVKTACTQRCEDYKSPLDGEWFIEEQNIYNEKYTESFCVLYNISKGEERYTGYIIESNSIGTVLNCNFGVISYSVNELTVIHTNVTGRFQQNIHNHIPKYFERFNIPLDDKHKRTFSLQGNTCDKCDKGTVLLSHPLVSCGLAAVSS